MKIPVYDSQVQISSGQPFQGVADTRNQSLSQIASGLDGIASKNNQDDLEQIKILNYKTETEAQFELDKKRLEIADRIENGGSYANAQKEYEGFYEKIKTKYGNAVFDDADKEQMLAKLQREALEGSLRIRGAVRTRARSDAVTAANNRVSLLEQEYLSAPDDKARESVVKKAAAQYGGLEGIGAINKGAGAEKIRNFIAKAEGANIRVLAETDPSAALQRLEKNKAAFDITSYTNEKMSLMRAIDKREDFKAVSNFLESGDVNTELSAKQVDNYTEEASKAVIKQELSPQNYEFGISDLISKKGIVPTEIKNALETSLSLKPELITTDSAEQAARSARIIVGSSNQNTNIIGGGAKQISKEDMIRAEMIVNRTKAGISEIDAVREVATLNRDGEDGIYQSAKKSFYSLDKDNYAKNREYIQEESGINLTKSPQYLPIVADAYATSIAMGANKDDAKKSAVRILKDRVSKFNGIDVEYSPTKITPYTDEAAWVEAGKNALNQIKTGLGADGAYLENAEPVLEGTSITLKDKNSGVAPNKIRFGLSVKDKNGYTIPILDDSGRRVYVSAGDIKLKEAPPKEKDLTTFMNSTRY